MTHSFNRKKGENKMDRMEEWNNLDAYEGGTKVEKLVPEPEEP